MVRPDYRENYRLWGTSWLLDQTESCSSTLVFESLPDFLYIHTPSKKGHISYSDDGQTEMLSSWNSIQKTIRIMTPRAAKPQQPSLALR